MLRVECIRELSSLDSIKNDWNRLSMGMTMRRPSWLLSWWEAYQESYRLCVLVARSEDKQVRGMMLLAETKNLLTGSTLVFMGSGKVCSDEQGILCERGYGMATADAFANWLTNSSECKSWDNLNLDGIRSTDRVMQRFGQTLCSKTQGIITYRPSPYCWKASLDGGMESYFSRLSKRARKILKNASAELVSGRSQFHVAESLGEAQRLLPQISRIHQMRWKERGIDGCFTEKKFTTFLEKATAALWDDPCTLHPDMSTDLDLSSSNRVHIATLQISGQTAAGAICFRDRDSLSVYLTGMNPEFADSKPGWQLLYGCIRHAISLQCDSIDFLRGDEEYKGRLGAIPSMQQRWVVPSRRWLSKLRVATYLAASEVKSWWQSPTIATATASANASATTAANSVELT